MESSENKEKDESTGIKSKESVKPSKKAQKPWRKKFFKEFDRKKTEFQKRAKTRQEKKICETQETELTEKSVDNKPETVKNKTHKKQPEKVKKKLRNIVQKSGPNKDLKRLQHGPKQDSKANRDEGRDPESPSEFRKVLHHLKLSDSVFL